MEPASWPAEANLSQFSLQLQLPFEYFPDPIGSYPPEPERGGWPDVTPPGGDIVGVGVGVGLAVEVSGLVSLMRLQLLLFPNS